VSGDRRPAPPGADLASLSRPDAIARLSGRAQSEAYDVSSAAAFAIAERFGTQRLLALYDAFNDRDLRGRPSPRLVNRALRRTLDLTLAELEDSLG
jgi:HEAT repeat protein